MCLLVIQSECCSLVFLIHWLIGAMFASPPVLRFASIKMGFVDQFRPLI